MDLKGKIVWVIGASSGIGAALAHELVTRGANVAVSARRADQLNVVAGGKMLALPADVTDLLSLERAATRIREKLGPIDIAIISAGYWKQMSGKNWQVQTFNDHVNINLIGTSNAIAIVLPEMLQRRSGHIAGISSVAGYRGLPGSEAYGPTKAAQINLLEALRISVAPSNVGITTICPGFVRTELTADNAFPMPFIIEAEKAAKEICDGFEQDRSVIIFPKPMAILMTLAKFVPAKLWVTLMSRNRQRRKGVSDENS